MSELVRLLNKKNVMISYMQEKIQEEDWHGVSDAANDLREIEVSIKYEQQKVSSANG